MRGRPSKGNRHTVAVHLPPELAEMLQDDSDDWGGWRQTPKGEIAAHALAIYYGRPELSPLRDTDYATNRKVPTTRQVTIDELIEDEPHHAKAAA